MNMYNNLNPRSDTLNLIMLLLLEAFALIDNRHFLLTHSLMAKHFYNVLSDHSNTAATVWPVHRTTFQ